MAQVPKFEGGGKSPSNVQEYNKQKQELQDLYNKKEREAKTILINGKRYDINEAKEKLQKWVSSEDSRDLKASYKRRGSGVDASYNRFLSALNDGQIQEITSTPSGFDVKYKDGIEGFNLGDKYSSDYLSKAIGKNFLNLSEYSNTLQEPDKIDVSWNPRDLINSVWGGKINQEVYNRKNTSERIDDVIKALESNRNRFYEYLSSEDKTPFKGYENLPFKSIQEYDQFIEDLSSGRDNNPNSEFDWEEQKNNQKYGDYIWKYIFGDSSQQNPSEQVTGTKPDTSAVEDEIRKANNLPEGSPLQYSFNGRTIVATKDGLRELNPDGTLAPLQGYYNFQADPSTYHLSTGWYDTNYIPFENLQNYLNTNVGYLNDVYNPEVYRWRKQAENIKYKKDWQKGQTYNAYYKLAKLLNLPEGEEYGIDYFNPYIQDNQATEDYEFVGINTPENIEKYLKSGRPYKSSNVYAINKKTNDIIPGELGYNQGYLQFKPSSNYPGFSSPINLNKILPDVVAGRNTSLNSQFLADLYNKYFNTRLQYQGANEAKGNTVAGGVPVRFQEGGVVRNTVSSGLQDKQAASMSDVFSGESLSAADKADLAALALDVAGLASTAVAGVGNVVGAVSGVGSTISTAIADYKRDDDWSWGDTGSLILNLGMDAATLVPGLGSVAKGAKALKRIKKVAPILHKTFTALGLTSALPALGKAVAGEELTINDWRLLANGLTAATGVGRNLAGRKYTQKAGSTEIAKPLEVTINGETKKVLFKNNEVEGFNKLSKADKLAAVKTKLKEQFGDNITQAEIDAVKLPNTKWYNPLTYKSSKVKESKFKGRELTPETIEKIKENKFNSFQRGLIAEQANFRRGKIQDQLIENDTYLGLDNLGNPTITKHDKIVEVTPKPLDYNKVSEASRNQTTTDLLNKVIKPSSSNEASLNSVLLENMTPFGTTRPPVEASGRAGRTSKSKAEAINWKNSKEGQETVARNKQKQAEETAKRKAAYRKGQETRRKNEMGYKDENKNLSKIIKYTNEKVENVNEDKILNLLIEQEERLKKLSATNAQPYISKSKHSSKPKKVAKKKSKDIGDRIQKHGEGGTMNFITQRNLLIKERDRYEIGSKEWIEANKKVKEFKNGGVIKYDLGGALDPKYNFSLKPMNTTLPETFSTESQVNLPTKSNLGTLPLTTVSSLASAISKSRANNKIYDTLRKGLKPALINLPTDLNYSIQGNEGVRQAYHKQASNLEGTTRKPLTSDASQQLAYNLEVAKNAAEARLQGDLANEQALQQSREKAFQVNANNLARREEAVNKNQLATTEYLNTLANLKAQKIGQNANIWDTFLHDVTEQTKQYINTNNARRVNEQILDKQLKNAELSSNDAITAADLQRRLDALYQKEEYKRDPNKIFLDPEYKKIIDSQKLLQLEGMKRTIDLQKLGLSGQYPKVFKRGGKIK